MTGRPWPPPSTLRVSLLDRLPAVTSPVRRVLRATLRRVAGAGPAHRRRLREADVRIAVSGTRGKSSAVRWLHDALDRRGYETFAKVTGTTPEVLHDGEAREVERGVRTTLYENERELRRVAPVDAVVVENQGIREYTTRLVNARYVDPHAVLVTNVREDHLDTLGSDRRYIARALARAVPAGTPVVCAEQHPTLREFFETEAARRDAPVTFVDVPDEQLSIPGAETVHGVSAVLEAVGEPPLPPDEIDELLERLRPCWRHAPGGRVYDATAVNDVESTEAIRRALLSDPATPIQPIVLLRSDRRGRSASFRRYLERLAREGAVEQARVVGDDADLFARLAEAPVLAHDPASTSAEDVLAAALADPWPVVLMGNAVTPFGEALLEGLDRLAVDGVDGEHDADAVDPDSTPRSDEFGAVASRTDPTDDGADSIADGADSIADGADSIADGADRAASEVDPAEEGTDQAEDEERS